MNKTAASAFIFILLSVSPAVAGGTVKGRVFFAGIPPEPQIILVKSDVSTCGSEQRVDSVLLSGDGGVAEALVRVIGAEGVPPVREGVLDQVGCRFIPHVQALPLGSTLKITSSDSVLHNAHGFREDGKTAFNVAVPIVGMEIGQKLDRPGILKIRCDAGHKWMNAYVVVVEEPFFTLTDAEGHYEIPDIPPGDYELEIWHEWLGVRHEPLAVREGEIETVNIELKKNEA